MFSFPLKNQSTKSQSKTFQIRFLGNGKDDAEQEACKKKKKKTERRRKKNYLFPAICLLNLKMTVAWEGILEVISEHLIMSDSWPVATFQAGVVCRF